MTGPQPQSEAIDVLARTLYGEARGEPAEGREAIACLVMNRVRKARGRKGGYWWGNTVAEVCRKPWQFSCWNADDPNREALLKATARNKVFAVCLRIARDAIEGRLSDPTGGATHYHARGITPPWARRRSPKIVIGDHLFYVDVE
ncbi:MAG: cell wall hydrolase [Magnetospirillum sp. WYHS-4]